MSDGGHVRWSVGSLICSLPRRTVKVDGNTDDWAGLWPQWNAPMVTDRHPFQPGTQMTKAFVCRDDKFLYSNSKFEVSRNAMP
jgi:hypothetical protein